MNRLRRPLAIMLILLAAGLGGWAVLRSTLVRRADLPRLSLAVPPADTLGVPTLSAVAVSPDSSMVAGAEYRFGEQHRDKRPASVFLWDARTGHLLQTIPADRWAVWNAAFSPDSRLIVTNGGDNTLKVWRTDTGGLVWTHAAKLDDNNAPLFAPNGKFVAAQDASGRIVAWDAHTGLPHFLPPMGMPPTEPKTYLGGAGIGFSPDGTLLAATLPKGSNEGAEGVDRFLGGNVRLWNARTGQMVRTLPGQWTSAFAFSPDGRRMASVCAADNTIMGGSNPIRVQMCDVQTGHVLWGVTFQRSVTSLVFVPHTHALALLTSLGSCRVDILNADTGAWFRALSPSLFAKPGGFMSTPYGLSVSKDGHMLVSRDSNHALAWDTSTLLP